MTNKYYENTKGQLFVDPILANHVGLTCITKKQFNAKLIIKNTPAPEQLYVKAKQDKILAVSQITVTTALGKVFDGDEISQNRMARAVTASNAGDTTQWILADNTQATVTHEELKEALLLAGNAMTVIWMA